MTFFFRNNFERSIDDNFDQYFSQHFDQTFENLFVDYGGQEDDRKERKKQVYIERNLSNYYRLFY